MARRNGNTAESATENQEAATETEGTTTGRTTNATREPEAQAVLDAKREAKITLRELAKATVDEALKAAIYLIVGTGTRAARGSVQSKNTVIRDAIVEAGSAGLSEMDIFKQFKIGQPEMSNKCRLFIKTDKPEDRVWIALDREAEVYRVEGTGADAPKDWTGFVPADETQL